MEWETFLKSNKTNFWAAVNKNCYTHLAGGYLQLRIVEKIIADGYTLQTFHMGMLSQVANSALATVS